MSELRSALIDLLRERGHERRDEPFRLSSGESSYDYVDGKKALASGDALKLASEAVAALADELGVDFEAVGGLTMGADPLAHGVAVLSGKRWFSVRKDAKDHGKRRLIEGTELEPGTAVVLVDDVVTTGASIVQALDAVRDAGAEVVLAVTLLDRGDVARGRLEERGVRYEPLATYQDLGIEPVGRGPVHAAAPR